MYIKNKFRYIAWPFCLSNVYDPILSEAQQESNYIHWKIYECLKIIDLSRKLLGKRLFILAMKATVYGHFVGGEDEKALLPTTTKLKRYGVKCILDYSVEQDVDQDSAVSKVK